MVAARGLLTCYSRHWIRDLEQLAQVIKNISSFITPAIGISHCLSKVGSHCFLQSILHPPVASLKEPAVTAVGGQELLPIASSVSSAKPPVTVPSVLVAEATLSTGITSSALSSSSSIRTEEVQHGSQLPAVYQVPNVCFQPSLLVGRLWNPWCRHLAGCYPRELCHPLLFFPIPVCCQPTDRHRDVCHDHWLRGLHRCHQRKQVLPAEFFYHAVNYISVGAHCCDSVLRLHRQEMIRSARKVEESCHEKRLWRQPRFSLGKEKDPLLRRSYKE
ncbi:tetraspanin-4 isoform X7 [Vidua macroura]|uniref:tetraspanin-4 isoform X7 n=1 Tax=Vidua macroura TaxID=187451 RepID=UPI0023A84389|nr:tetraspanin-4 isoform X7 [Vidua macroura]